MSKLRRWGALATALLLVSGVLAACGGGSSNDSSTSGGASTSAPSSSDSSGGSSASSTSGAGGGGALDISATENGGLGFSNRALTARAGTVTIRLANGSGNSMPHGIAIEGNGVDRDGQVVQPGGTSTVTVRLKPGRYTFYCPVGDHEAEGMKGTLTVS
jgi:plastocyanin